MEEPNILQSLSSLLAGVVESSAPSIVRVDDGSRLSGTGVVWTSDGVILTTSHGLERDEDIAIELQDGRRVPASLVGRDGDTDIALVRAQASDLTPIRRAHADEAKVGSLALALGRPGEAGLQATIGIVSARQDSEREGRDEWILHTDAILYPGFSGGALVGAGGAMLGLLNRGFGRGSGVALGVPILESTAQSLLQHGSVRRGFLGISTQAVAIPPALQQSSGVSQERGLLIAGVGSNSAAEKGGLMLGDVLLSVDGVATLDAEELRARLRSMSAGQSVALQVLRGGARRDISATLGSDG